MANTLPPGNARHSLGVQAVPLPDGALLETYRARGDFTDCYSTVVPCPVSHAEFVEAFYTTRLFGLERFVLKVWINRPSTHAEAHELAIGQRDSFAAWRVEARAENQILLADFMGRTRSWLMVQPFGEGDAAQTRLFFGSCVVKTPASATQASAAPAASAGLVFRMLGWFHAPYSIALLAAARRRLHR